MTIREDPPGRGALPQRALRRPPRLRLGAPAAAAALLLLAGCGQPHSADPAPARTRAPQGPYVALGDSYTAGIGVPTQVGTPAGCERSSRNYPALLAQHLKLKADKVHDVSCSGATIADLTGAQGTDSGTNPAQLSALTSDTALVTLGIGGNDVDFAGVLTRCVELDAPETILDLLRHGKVSTTATPCRSSYTVGDDQIGRKIQTAATGVAAALGRIRRLAPHARVFVVGYPDLFPTADGSTCGRSLGVTPGDVAYLDNEELRLNSMLKQQAAAAHDTYIDTYSPSVGHDACSAAATRWIEPLLTEAGAAPLHPNAVGQQGVADAVEHAVTAGG